MTDLEFEVLLRDRPEYSRRWISSIRRRVAINERRLSLKRAVLLFLLGLNGFDAFAFFDGFSACAESACAESERVESAQILAFLRSRFPGVPCRVLERLYEKHVMRYKQNSRKQNKQTSKIV